MYVFWMGLDLSYLQ